MIVNPMIYSGRKLPELDNPGTAADLLAGKQLVDQYGNPLMGTMPEVVQATPSISVSSSGLITASATQDAGHVAEGTKSATMQLTTQAGKTVTPTTSKQTAVPSGRYTTGAVYVAGDANLKAENIKSGATIFGIAGLFSGKEVKTQYLSSVPTTRLSNTQLKIDFSSLQDTPEKILFATVTLKNAYENGVNMMYNPVDFSSFPWEYSPYGDIWGIYYYSAQNGTPYVTSNRITNVTQNGKIFTLTISFGKLTKCDTNSYGCFVVYE